MAGRPRALGPALLGYSALQSIVSTNVFKILFSFLNHYASHWHNLLRILCYVENSPKCKQAHFDAFSAARNADMQVSSLGTCVSMNARRRKCAVHLHTQMRYVSDDAENVWQSATQCKRSISTQCTQSGSLFIVRGAPNRVSPQQCQLIAYQQFNQRLRGPAASFLCLRPRDLSTGTSLQPLQRFARFTT